MLWVIFAILLLVTLAALLLPLLRGSLLQAPSRIEYDIVVYRDQLAEIDQEVDNGQLSPSQADAARAEIHRRMLATEDAQVDVPVKGPLMDERYSRFVAIVLLAVLIPVGAAVIYSMLGSPRLPGKPYAWRMANDPEIVAAASAEAFSRLLQANPTADGYRRLAEMYFNAKNYVQAAAADRRAIELGSNDAASWSELGEAIVMSNDGTVVPEAMMAFANSINANPRSERARFYIGLAEAQIGNLRQAVAIWRDLEKSSDPDAPWLGMVREHITVYAKQGGFDPQTVPPAPPAMDTLNAAVSAMTSATGAPPAPTGNPPASVTAPSTPVEAPPAGDDPNTMIRAMVARLADRLEQNPTDIEGWKRLAHSYVVLGDNAKARQAIDRAVSQKPDDVSVLLGLAEVQRASSGPDNNTADDFIGTMRKILGLDAGNVPALYYVGLAEQKAGHTDKAVVLWKKALSLSQPDEPLSIAIHNRLDAIAKNQVVH